MPYADKRPTLYAAIAGLDRVLIRSRVSAINSILLVTTGQVFSEQTVVFTSDDYGMFALLQSCAHTEWLNRFASSLRTDVRYTPSDCFETFAFPPSVHGFDSIGQRYHEHRRRTMQQNREGVTRTYTRVFDPRESAPDIQRLRELHVELDQTVAAGYGWSDIKLDHGFHETRQGVRFTISEAARREVLDRLLALNHERHAEEEAAKEAGKQTKKRTPRKRVTSSADEIQGVLPLQ